MRAFSLAIWIVSGSLFGIFCLGLIGLLAGLLYAVSGLGNKQISADLAFFAKCSKPEIRAIDTLAEDFLQKRNFAVLNKVQAAKRLDQPALLLVDILAVDHRSREITLMLTPFDTDSISIGLRTPPPTKHDDELEEALLSFAGSTLGCRVYGITRSDNGPERLAFHKDLIRLNVRMFKAVSEH